MQNNKAFSANIQTYCHIKNGNLFIDGSCIYKSYQENFKDFSREVYDFLGVDYSKFFKMDSLSKLAFIGAELCLKKIEEKDIALIFSNKASSMEIDRKHQQTINSKEEFYPSPSNFVYTLPNICLGEISIKHTLYSENSFFIFEKFNPEILVTYTSSLLQEKKAKMALCAWVEIEDKSYEAFLYLVGKNGKWPHTKEILTKIY